jgi:hypothetical protein
MSRAGRSSPGSTEQQRSAGEQGQGRRFGRHRSVPAMPHHLPLFATFGMVALLVGPLARLPIDLGADLLEWLTRPAR